MKKQVLKTTDDAARLAAERVRIYREPFALAPWDRDHTDAPLVYWSPSYTCGNSATPCPMVEENGEAKTAPGIYRAQVYAYEYDGVTVSTRPQSCGGVPCGCVWCPVEAFRDYYGDGVSFEDVARDFVAEVDAYYKGDVFAVDVEAWDAAARDWECVDTCGNVYPGEDDAATLAALIGPGVRPGRVVCADDDAPQFVGMEYDDGAPLAGPTVEQTEQAGIVAADCCRWCVNCSRIEGVNGGVVRFACSRFGFATFATDICSQFKKQ